jgi:chromosome segregation ATPase
VTQEELDGVVNELSEALMAEVEELRGALAGLQARGSSSIDTGDSRFEVIKESLEAMASEIEASEAKREALAAEVEVLQAALAESTAGARSMDIGNDTELHAEGRDGNNSDMQRLLGEVAALRSSVAGLKASDASGYGGSSSVMETEELDELRAAVSELRSAAAGVHRERISLADVEGIVDARSEALAADIEALKAACEELRRKTGSTAADSLEEMSRHEELLHQVEVLTRQSEATASELEQLHRAMAAIEGKGSAVPRVSSVDIAELWSRVHGLEGQMQQSDLLTSELEALKASVVGLEAGEAGRTLDTRSYSSALMDDEHQDVARVKIYAPGLV